MKTLVLVRHSKSSWKLDAVSDMYRPLSERGHKDAHDLSLYLSSQNLELDLIYSSPAVRAFTTGLYIASGLSLKKSRLFLRPELYPGTVNDVIRLISLQKRAVSGIVVVGHNDMITDLTQSLCPKFRTTMFTSGTAVLQLRMEDWSNIQKMKAQLVDYYVGGKGKEI